jgi:comEA protein
MSFYRSLIVAVAAMGLATSVFAADDAATTNAATTNETTAQAPADANQQPAQANQTANNDANANQANSGDASNMTADAGEKVDLNKATAKDLMKVKGLNAAKAKAIVSYRKKNGDFKSVDDLKEVKGFKKMNEKTLKKIQDQLTVG